MRKGVNCDKNLILKSISVFCFNDNRIKNTYNIFYFTTLATIIIYTYNANIL
jgi:hypothetical protein